MWDSWMGTLIKIKTGLKCAFSTVNTPGTLWKSLTPKKKCPIFYENLNSILSGFIDWFILRNWIVHDIDLSNSGIAISG